MQNRSTVINLVSGDRTIVKKIDKNCYVLEYTNCEVNQVTERFIMAFIEGYMEDNNLELIRKWWEIF